MLLAEGAADNASRDLSRLRGEYCTECGSESIGTTLLLHRVYPMDLRNHGRHPPSNHVYGSAGVDCPLGDLVATAKVFRRPDPDALCEKYVPLGKGA